MKQYFGIEFMTITWNKFRGHAVGEIVSNYVFGRLSDVLNPMDLLQNCDAPLDVRSPLMNWDYYRVQEPWLGI